MNRRIDVRTRHWRFGEESDIRKRTYDKLRLTRFPDICDDICESKVSHFARLINRLRNFILLPIEVTLTFEVGWIKMTQDARPFHKCDLGASTVIRRSSSESTKKFRMLNP